MEEQVHRWLSKDAFPLWLSKGVDNQNGGFHEELNLETGCPIAKPKRTMVQARQIYCFRVGYEKGFVDSSAEGAIRKGGEFLLRARQPNGSFAHSLKIDGQICDERADLYAQAFALFGLAQLFRFTGESQFREAAQSLVAYLERERRLEGGGFSEISATGLVHGAANPHMHLLEATLEWSEIDSRDVWSRISREVSSLAQEKMFHQGLLCEHFEAGWEPKTNTQGAFIFEPGHHYEWAWLLLKADKFFGETTYQEMAKELYRKADEHGIHASSGMVYDEIWSDLSIKSVTHRFWPQCERIKAALSLGDHDAADKATRQLYRFFETEKKGLWYDTFVDGAFRIQQAKASSFYHIVNALTIYLEARQSQVLSQPK